MKKIFFVLLFLFVLVGCEMLDNKTLVTLIQVQGDKTMDINATQDLTVVITPLDATNQLVDFASSDTSILMVDETGKVTALKAGDAVITVKSKDGSNIQGGISIKVSNPNIFVSSITINGDNVVETGKETVLGATVEPSNANNKTFTWSTSDESIALIDSLGKVTGIKAGEVTIKATANDGNGVYGEFKMTVKDNQAPVITIDETISKKDVEVGYNQTFDILKGLSATDDFDGDLTKNIVANKQLDNRVFGKQEIEFSVTDEAGNKGTFTRTFTVVWNSSVTFIGHAGCYSGIMNTEEAFINALTLHSYQAIECDVKQTSDGVFVVCHDDTFNGIALASTTYENIKDVEYTTSRGGISYTTKICTFKRYLEICKEYNAYAVVELKSSKGITNSDQSRMSALMDVIKEVDMLDKVIFLGSQYNCLIWVKQNGYPEVPCQYLVNSCESSTIYNRCVEYNLDISFNVDDQYSNSQEWIDRYHDVGLKVAGYTFSQYTDADDLQEWINKKLDYVTVDVTKPYEVTLPIKQEDTRTKYTVQFVDYNDTVLYTTKTPEGTKAISPISPTRKGYTFDHWDKDFSNVTADMIVKAVYKGDTYNITYKDNMYNLSESTWDSKEAFLTELYTDWFNWFDSNVGKIEGLTKKNSTYTLVKSGTTATWTDVASLRALDIYVVEKTLGALAYKPVESRVNNTTPVEPVGDNGYFLNTEPYRTKYRAMDGYLLNCINAKYPGYSNTFTPTSAGKVQIFFRFHQWNKGTSIPPFDTLPKKYVQTKIEGVNVVMPTTNLTYTIEDEFNLPVATAEGYTFGGWYSDVACTKKVEKITKGSEGNIEVYAKWTKN